MKRCLNCGIPIHNDPMEVGAHEVQAKTVVNQREYCSACSSPDYTETGKRIVEAASVDLSDDELVQLLADTFEVKELRPWLRSHDISRSRGSSKVQSCYQAVEQNRVAVASEMMRRHRTIGVEPWIIMCNCGLETPRYSREDAISLAKNHSIKNADCAANVFHESQHVYGVRQR